MMATASRSVLLASMSGQMLFHDVSAATICTAERSWASSARRKDTIQSRLYAFSFQIWMTTREQRAGGTVQQTAVFGVRDLPPALCSRVGTAAEAAKEMSGRRS